MDIGKNLENLIKSKGEQKFKGKLSKNNKNMKNKNEKPNNNEDNEQEDKPEPTKKSVYGFETGAPPIVVVVQGGKGVS